MADQRVTTAAVITDPATSTQQANVDASGNLQVDVAASTLDLAVGTDISDVFGTAAVAAAENAAAPANVLTTAGRYDATPRTLGDGDVGAIALDADGAVHISDGGNAITVDGTVSVTGVATEVTLLVIAGLAYTDDTDTHTSGTSKAWGIGAVATPTDTAVDANDIGMLAMSLDRRLLVDADITAQSVGALDVSAATVTVDSELPAAAALADDAANPTAPAVGSHLMGYDSGNTNWNRVEVDDAGHLQVDILSGSSSATEYTEDDAAPANPVGTAGLMERDDVLGGLTPIAGDWTHMFCSAEGALWTQDFNSDALLADTNSIVTAVELIDNAVSGTGFNISQLNGVNVTMDNGASGTGVQRVTIANDSTGILATVSTVTSLTQMNGAAISMNTGVRDAGTQRVTIATDDSVPTVEAAPTNPAFDEGSTVALAAGSSANIDTADIASKKMTKVIVAGSVPFKVVVSTLTNAVATTVLTGFGDGGNAFIFEPPHKDYLQSGSSAGADGFRAAVTNLDPNDAADFYATFFYED